MKCHKMKNYVRIFEIITLTKYGKYSKISKTFLFLFSDKILVFKAGFHKMLV